MPKLKTHKGVARRFKKTGTGKMVYFKGGRRHLLTGKSSRKQRPRRKSAVTDATNVEKLKQLMPYA
jgi:large subunit ribosomal protein L35